MKRNYSNRRGPPRQRTGTGSQRSASRGSKSESEDGGKKRAAPSRRGSLLGTATRRDVPAGGDGTARAAPMGQGFFDRMLGLSISSRTGKAASQQTPPPPPPPQPAEHVWQQPLPWQRGGAASPVAPEASSGSLEALAAKGWAGMPQVEDNSPASVSGASAASSSPTTVGGGPAAAPAVALEAPSSSQGRRSGSGSLGSLAAMMPWIRVGRGTGGSATGGSQQQQASSSQGRGGGGGGLFSSFGRRSQSAGTHSQRSRGSASGLMSTDSTLLPGSLGEAPRFAHPKYHLVESNRLEPKDPATPVTTRDLNTVMEATASYVVECMRFYYHVQEVAVPSKQAKARCTIVASQDWQTAKQLMVLVPNHLNGCPLGLWSRSLCIDQGLRFGTMLPYVDTAYREGFAVIICNPAATSVAYKDGKGATHKVPIEGAATPEEHMAWVYDHMLTQARADHVVLVGYGHGARLCKEMLRRSLTYQHPSAEVKPLATIALIEACRLKEAGDAAEVTEFLASPRAVNLKKSQHPIGRALPDVAAAIGVGQCFSLGTAGPDTNPAWSIYQGMGEVFKFCQRRAPEKKSPRLNLKGLGLLGSFSRGRSGGSSSRQQQQAPQQPPQQPPQQQGAVVSGASSTDRSAALATGGRSVSSAHSHPGLGTAPAATSSTATSSNMSCASGPYAATESVDQTDACSATVATAEDVASIHGGLRRKDSWSSLLDRKEYMTVENFVLERVIGKGAFGKVMMVRVRNDPARRVYAMKVINKSEIIRRGYIDSTKLERAILCESEHPFIVRLRFAFQNGAKLYLVTDFYNGGNLLVHLKRNCAFPERAARFFAAEVFLAIEYLHRRGIVYRDLKPENVLMESSGHVALTDFGLSKLLPPGERTSTFCGTAEYLAPEQLRRAPYDSSVDWWAFGIFVYEMLVGRSPFYNRSRTNMYERIVNEDPAFPPQMGADACDIIGLLLKKAPESRLAGGEIRAHPFFRDIDWELLRAKEVTPPINPEVGRASDCRYISSRYLTLEPRDTDEGDACARFSDFTFIGEDTYQRAVGCGGGHGGGRHGVGPHGGLLLHHPTPHAAQAGGDGRESYCTSGSDATPFSTGAYTTSSALTSSSKGSATGGGYEPSVEPAGVADPHHLVGNAHGHRHPYAHAHAHHAHAHAALYHHPQHPQAQQPQAQQPKAGGPDALASSYLPLHTAQAPPGAYAHHYHYPQQQPSRGMRRVHSGGSHSGHGGHEQQYGAHPGGGAYPPGPALAYPHMPMPPPPPPPPSHHDSASAVPAFPHPHHPHPPTALLPPPPLPLVPLPAPAAATAQPPSVVFSDASVGGDSGRSIVTSLTASLTVSGLEQRGAGGGGAGAASLAASVASSGGGTESSPPSPLP